MLTDNVELTAPIVVYRSVFGLKSVVVGWSVELSNVVCSVKVRPVLFDGVKIVVPISGLTELGVSPGE